MDVTQSKPMRVITGLLLVMWLAIFAAGATSTRTGIHGTTGSTDNAILRADGTGGINVQSSGVTITDGGNVAVGNGFISNDGDSEGLSFVSSGGVKASSFGIGTFPNFPLEVNPTNVGATTTTLLANNDNTNAASNVRLILQTGGNSSGDPFLVFTRGGGTDWYMGEDNSDSDAFVIGLGSLPGAFNVLRIDQSSLITVRDTYNFAYSMGTGTKHGTAPTQKMGFWNAAPVVQPSANADTSGATLGDLETEVNQLKALLRSVGFMAP